MKACVFFLLKGKRCCWVYHRSVSRCVDYSSLADLLRERSQAGIPGLKLQVTIWRPLGWYMVVLPWKLCWLGPEPVWVSALRNDPSPPPTHTHTHYSSFTHTRHFIMVVFACWIESRWAGECSGSRWAAASLCFVFLLTVAGAREVCVGSRKDIPSGFKCQDICLWRDDDFFFIELLSSCLQFYFLTGPNKHTSECSAGNIFKVNDIRST